MTKLLLDTHAVIWLVQDDPRLSAAANLAINEASTNPSNLLISTITLVEAQYLIDRQRIPPEAYNRLIRAVMSDVPLATPVELTVEIARSISRVPRDLVPDMPDRILAATALVLGVPLVTRDERLRDFSEIQTIW